MKDYISGGGPGQELDYMTGKSWKTLRLNWKRVRKSAFKQKERWRVVDGRLYHVRHKSVWLVIPLTNPVFSPNPVFAGNDMCCCD
jgi:hypothetical protein